MTTYTTAEFSTMGYEKANELLSPMNPIERLKILENAPESMTPFAHWIRFSKAEIMQMYMNALTTMSCGGHSKSERNEMAVKRYLEIMEKHEIPVPTSDVAYILGVFNGVGSC